MVDPIDLNGATSIFPTPRLVKIGHTPRSRPV